MDLSLRSSVICDSHVFRLKSQIDDFVFSLDDICTKPLKKLITLCFSTPDGCDIAFEETFGVALEERCSPTGNEKVGVTTEQEQFAPPSAKKLKLSLHSKKCENSPHNRRLETVASTPKPVHNPDAVPKPTRGRGKKIVRVDETLTNSVNAVQVTVFAPKESDDQDVPTAQSSETIVPEVPEKETPSNSTSQIPVSPTHTPQQPASVTYVVPDSSSKTSPIPPLSLAAAAVLRPEVAEPVTEREVPTSTGLLPQEDESVAPLVSAVPASKPASSHRGCALETTNQKPKQTSLGNYHSVAAKVRLFASSERLGGASRLNTVGLGSSSKSVRTSGKPAAQRISQQLNESQNGNSSILGRTNERSRSIQATKEQQLYEKRLIYESRIKLDEARMRAFQEAKAREREAQKRANEQHRLAVKLKAQQMADLQRMVNESKKQLSEERIKADLEKQKTVESVKRKHLAPIVEQENAALPSQPVRPVKIIPNTAEHTPAAPNVLKAIQLQKTGPNSALQTTTAVKRAHPTPIQPAPVAKAPLPNTASKAQPTRAAVVSVPKLPPTQPTAAATVKPTALESGRLPNSPLNATFNMSLLNSDSEDEDKPYIKAPSWSRKDNLKQLPSFNAVVAGELRFPSKFIPAAQIQFDLDSMFAGYDYRRRHRTSSRFWNTPVAL
ncbi:hypothetical protein CRM22_007753 [Opisthorchis felineus]|uniref:Uncharacterized protein n=1 Tax=Opisthorchis felineus TaxID=147828 RepID=A0A4S2LED3_OPIFE|nr:hypothetical protein CRM22_007753 [Opisthorchis felineus]